MASIARPLTQLVAFTSATFILAGVAAAQAPASAAFPPTAADAQPAPPAPPPPSPSATAVAPTAQPAPPPAYPQQPAPPEPPPPPAPGTAVYAQPGYGYGYPPPPPPQNPDDGFKVPEFSIRVDPFNWLLQGRLGLELETQVYKFVSVELVPVFVTTSSPPTLNYDSYSSAVTQSSNGIGAISGAALDAAFWFDGKPFRGYALRTGFTNYSYKYNSSDNGVAIDSASHTEREFFVMLADASRWGAFTIGGGFGLGYELNRQNRCFDNAGAITSDCPKDEMLIKLDQSGTPGNLNGFCTHSISWFDFHWAWCFEMKNGEIVVTGAGGALGSGVVRALAASGRRVIAVERDAERAEKTFAGVAGCRVLAFDISQAESWTRSLGNAEIAGAVLIAGTWKGGRRMFEAGADADWSALLSANLETARVSLQALLPRLVAAKSGSVVAIASRTAVRPWEGARSAGYAASKAALVALVQAAAAEVLEDGVRINALLPSTIDTPANRAAMPKHDPSTWVSVESLSGVISFLLSDTARDISGAAIPVYGRDGV